MLRAGEQTDAEFLFELANLMAQRRLAEVRPFDRAPEIQSLGKRHGMAKVSPFRGADSLRQSVESKVILLVSEIYGYKCSGTLLVAAVQRPARFVA